MNRLMKTSVLVLAFALIMSSCSRPSQDNPGSEYMPDMGHSIAYEANIYNYYYLNTWDETSVKKLKELSIPKEPVAGTVPRGYAGVHFASTATAKSAVMNMHKGGNMISEISIPVNGSVPYYYEDTEEERTRAMNEIIDNPFPITEKGLEQGKELYDINCGICHGKKGDGNGYLVAEENPNAAYPAQPAIFTSDEFVAASNGRYYHSIIYGKNVMGGYADKLSYEERWNVIHYIRSLQAKDRKLVYNSEMNTLNDIDVPAQTLQPIAEAVDEVENASGDHATDHGEGGHGTDSDHGHGDDADHGNGHDAEHGEEHSEGDHGHGESNHNQE
ncbi:MAG: cytochrome c [Bacteroidota bacterium]